MPWCHHLLPTDTYHTSNTQDTNRLMIQPQSTASNGGHDAHPTQNFNGSLAALEAGINLTTSQDDLACHPEMEQPASGQHVIPARAAHCARGSWHEASLIPYTTYTKTSSPQELRVHTQPTYIQPLVEPNSLGSTLSHPLNSPSGLRNPQLPTLHPCCIISSRV